jgi:hypothetical protein
MLTSSESQMKKFLLKILLIFSIIIICDRVIGTILEHFYFSQKSGTGYRTTYSIDSTKADILVFGSSRANHSYVPEIFENRLFSTFYNTGKDGNFILYNNAIFRAITRRYNPKMIIIDISPEELTYSKSEYERLSSLLPYYKSHPEIGRIADLRGPFEKIKNFSATYPYNSLILMIAFGNLESNILRKPDTKGYVPLFKTMNRKEKDTLNINYGTIDENKLAALRDIISICNKKNIDLVFVHSPIWNINQINFCESKLFELCSSGGNRYLDLSTDQTFINSPDYFADINHLNDKGARVFSNMVVDRIMQIE